MGTETRDLLKLVAVTDHDTAMYHMGEVDFRYSDEVLIDHIERYGADELLNMLGFMTHIVWTAKLGVVKKEQAETVRSSEASSSVPE